MAEAKPLSEDPPETLGRSSEFLSRLLLVGTVHSDPEGFRRSLRLFRFLEPDLVLVELSPFALRFRQEHQQRFHRTLRSNLQKAAANCGVSLRDAIKHPEVAAIRRQISLPFEYRAAFKYSRLSGAALIPVDYSVFSKEWIETWPELISVENLTSLLSLPSRARSVENIYRSAAIQIAADDPRQFERLTEKSKWSEGLWEERERFMVERIREALKKFRPDRAVFLGGWWHLRLSDTPPTLRAILGIPSARCILLNQDASASK